MKYNKNFLLLLLQMFLLPPPPVDTLLPILHLSLSPTLLSMSMVTHTCILVLWLISSLLPQPPLLRFVSLYPTSMTLGLFWKISALIYHRTRILKNYFPALASVAHNLLVHGTMRWLRIVPCTRRLLVRSLVGGM
uniref:Uncharacterized protein n=1 Tax=Molossus molossus TaxID=27622 RepID=A0A7J8FYZ6_MOLMO|nr:hypothetical protein HJG59_008198 [Molossus molossus]